jgi:hypothetical protein
MGTAKPVRDDHHVDMRLIGEPPSDGSAGSVVEEPLHNSRILTSRMTTVISALKALISSTYSATVRATLRSKHSQMSRGMPRMCPTSLHCPGTMTVI